MLTLADCIGRALSDGPAYAASRELLEANRSRYRMFRSGLLPQMSLQGQAPGYLRSISSVTQPDGSTLFAPQSQANSSLSLSISQQVSWTGGTVSLSSGLTRIDLLETNTTFYRSTPFSFTWRQPLFQLNTVSWNIDLEELRMDIAHRAWEESKEEVSIDITNKFFETYLSAMNVENARNNVRINDTLFQISTGRYNVGKIAENELLQSELALMNARTQLANATIANERARKALAFSIGLRPGTALLLVPPEEVPSLRIDPAAAVGHALANRSEVTDQELQKLTAERNLKDAKLKNTFSAMLVANAGFNQRAGSIPESYRQLLDQQQLSINLEVPLVQWGGGAAEIEAALAEQRRTELSNTIRKNALVDEVYSQVMLLRLLQEQVGISAKTDTIARRRFEVAKDRYLIGKIDVTNLFLAQSEMDQARRSRTQTLWDFWTAYYRLRRLTLHDFAIDAPLHREPN